MVRVQILTDSNTNSEVIVNNSAIFVKTVQKALVSHLYLVLYCLYVAIKYGNNWYLGGDLVICVVSHDFFCPEYCMEDPIGCWFYIIQNHFTKVSLGLVSVCDVYKGSKHY